MEEPHTALTNRLRTDPPALLPHIPSQQPHPTSERDPDQVPGPDADPDPHPAQPLVYHPHPRLIVATLSYISYHPPNGDDYGLTQPSWAYIG